jgi:hypothetical protein
MGKMKKRLVIVGVVFLFITAFLIATSFVIENAKAEGASGTWTGTCTVDAGAAYFYYDVTLTLNGESSVSGTLSLYCTDVDVEISGYEESMNMIGTTTNDDVEGELSGSALTLYVYDSSGTYTFIMTISGGTMTGGGSYDSYGAMITWSFDLTSGGGGFGDLFGTLDVATLAGPAAAVAAIGGSASFAASFLPGPSGIRGHKNRPPVFYRRGAVKQITYPARIPQPVQTPQQPQPSQQPQQLVRPPSADPNNTLNLPIQDELGPTNGDHLVPWDAPQQWTEDVDPPGYPYPKGTNSSMECPYCHCITLSPFASGWYCTNPLCPARRENVQKGYTHHRFNNMTWRQP